MKITKKAVFFVVAFALVFSAALPGLASEEPVLTIRGDGVEQEVSFTLAELKGMTGNISRNAYSAWNTWPSKRVYYAEGIAISALIEKAGLKAGATTINISEAPPPSGAIAYNMTFLLSDLLGERYTFEGSKTVVPAILAFKLSEKGFTDMDEVALRLIHGQLAEQDQTTVGFVQRASIITVTSDPIRQLAQPKAAAELLADGRYSVTLTSDNARAKIYYTTDGTTPTANSTMYNISDWAQQQHLNAPFTVSGTTQVKAIAIDSGFSNSDVLSFTPASLNGGGDTPGSPEKPDGAGMVNFVRSGSYQTGQFGDINENAWYGVNQQKAIANAFEHGLMRGSSAAAFNPGGNVTIAEAITIAARVHSIYSTGSEGFTQGTPWYQVYVDYAVSSGIIAASNFSGYTRAATRAEMAYIFSRALPQSEFKEQNTVNSLPDVGSDTLYRESILMLYKAGVLTGSDAQGTFHPDRSISRAEAAAIISRIILPDTRVSGGTFPIA